MKNRRRRLPLVGLRWSPAPSSAWERSTTASPPSRSVPPPSPPSCCSSVASSRPLWWCQACGCGADRGQRASRSLGEPRQVQDGRRQMSSVGWRWSVTRRAARLVDLQRRYSPQTERTRRHRPAARPCHRGHPRGCQHAASATPQPVAVVPRRVRSVPRPLRAGAAGGVPNLQLDVLRIVEPQPCAGGQIRVSLKRN